MAKYELTSSVATFERLRKANYLYVDKTEYLWNLIRFDGAQYFLSRPRRFGKSLTLSTLEAIFAGKKELFQGLSIYNKPYDWKQHPVIRLNMNGRDFSTAEALENSLRNIVAEQARKWHVQLEREDAADMLQNLIESLAQEESVVVLVDEYDKPLLDTLTSPLAKDVLVRLKSFYSVIKEKEKAIRFAFVTGVTKFCHASLFSDLNNLTDITMEAPYATMLGYTQSEFEADFGEWLAETEARQELPHTEFLGQIKQWYDGFRFMEDAESVYNPVSVATFFRNGGKFSNYWFETGTPTFLIDLIRQRNVNLQQVIAQPVTAFAFSAFETGNIPPVTLLLQTGYLTIKSAEKEDGRLRYHLDFPNTEIREAFNVYLLNAYAQQSQDEIATFCDRLSHAVRTGDLKKFNLSGWN